MATDIKLKRNTRRDQEFLADIAHEFQTPLAILRGNLEILATENDGDPNVERYPAFELRAASKHEKLRAITSSKATLDRLSRLVNELLAAEKLRDSPRNEMCLGEINVAQLLEETYYDCALLAEDAGISFSLWFAESDAATFLRGNRDKLKEALLNLLSNALKYTPSDGAISLAMKTVRDETSDHVEILVADTGSGIASENLPHIFERLYTIPLAAFPFGEAGFNDRPKSGNGIGLYLCRQIVEAHGGTISVKSELGEGSKFTISLPLTRP